MTQTIYIVFNKQGVDRMLKTSSRMELARGEKYVEVSVTIPDSIFAPPPQLTASLVVTPEAVTGEGTIVLDPNASIRGDKGDPAQGRLNLMAAQLIEKAINSTDRAMKDFALDALAICRESGVTVKIDLPEAEEDSNV